ncbi:MAG TPA: GGDEF domain-containing protein [Vicinamibacterales bacterium]|nr:GGDEF domain-containing protein [Vicinamibacterales bacterium]
MTRPAGRALLLTAAAWTQLTAIAAAQATAVQGPKGIAPDPTFVDPRGLVGAGAIVVTALLLLLYFYRRRVYILYWIGGWILLAASMFLAIPVYASEQPGWFAYGVSQFLAIVSALVFVLSADAYRAPPQLRRSYVYVMLPLLLWFALAPIALGPTAAFAPGHLLIAGGLAAAGIAHLVLLRHTPMLGAATIGLALLALAAANVWTALAVPDPTDEGSTQALIFSLVMYLVAGLGMQLMTFEDMTMELRTTNTRLEKAQEELRQMVITDPLTGCRNRRFFDEIIGRELQRHLRYDVPLSLLFIDIDRFKSINDTLGHEAGDLVLRQVAAFLVRNVREADYVFRWGGDEFLILISCREDEARRRGIALQGEFAASEYAASLPPGVGLSVGCTELPPDTKDVLAHIKAADERMYADKRRTRGGRQSAAVPRRR